MAILCLAIVVTAQDYDEYYSENAGKPRPAPIRLRQGNEPAPTPVPILKQINRLHKFLFYYYYNLTAFNCISHHRQDRYKLFFFFLLFFQVKQPRKETFHDFSVQLILYKSSPFQYIQLL